MQDRPTARELLGTLAAFVDDELLPALQGPLRYRTLVASNLLKILEREQRHGAGNLLREREQLCNLLGLGSDDLVPGALPDQVADLNQQLVSDLDANDVHADATQVWQVLMQITRAKLAIARPGYDAWDSSVEQP